MKRFYLIVALALVVLVLPVILWLAKDSRTLSVTVIDKTVPDETHREHLGLVWALNHMKVVRPDGKKYEAARDYTGFVPDEERQTYKLRPPAADYSGTDVLYIADTYGVYEEDLPWAESERKGGRSEKVHGGLSGEEWDAVEQRMQSGDPLLLISEYNTFASPTGEKVRNRVMSRLGVDWAGWTGRYFEELDFRKSEEIPSWLAEQYGEKWTYEGPGFLLVNDLTGEVVALERDRHLTGEGIRLSFTKEGKERFGMDSSPRYDYWFDIVTPADGGRALAEYDWGLTEEGRRLLGESGIPAEFAAVVSKKSGASESIYFAGDYNDVPSVPRIYQMQGLPQVYRVLNAFSDQSFYWSAYVPMIGELLDGFGKKEAEAVLGAKAEGDDGVYSRIAEDRLEVFADGEWKPLTVKGVNVGMGKPGHFPGEAAISEEEYARWFEKIGEMNANTIRVYTLHPPGFYRALKAYNESHDKPLYVMHGVWINEEKLEESLDAFEEENLKDFREEMQRIVDVVHGDADLPERPGHASGYYDADISQWVSAWMVGIEWYPYTVQGTNEKHAGIGDFDGDYYRTKGAQPFEYWLAEQMEWLTAYEHGKYGALRAMSFTNWVTTDLLDHPAESAEQEDLVSVDPNLIAPKGDMEQAGMFASYHVYPYYPDFLNYERRYLEFRDHRGEPNNYAAYLKELKEAHRMPILIAEFGIPASRGKTHENPFGWNQGFMSEQEQGEVLKRLYEDILHEGMLGGLVFTWQDEWFKRTWNTLDYDNPDRRPFWSNAQTNEQQFGLLSFDRLKVKVDGEVTDWTGKPIYEKKAGPIRAVYVDHDERYLYVRLDMEPGADGYPVVLLDTVPDQGNTTIGGIKGAALSDGLEFIASLNGEESRLLIDPYYDFHHFLYGKKLGLIQDVERVNDSGRFIPIEYALNKAYEVANENRTIPFTAYETGKLREGNGNPESPDYDSLADYHAGEGVVELRLPWLLLQAKDPSMKEFMGNLAEDGESASVIIDRIGLGVLMVGEDGRVADSLPEADGGKIGPLKGYTWDNWDVPEWEERLKQSYGIMKKAFEED
ncbi:hypothetical protein SAMN04488126_103213 [Bhargavaea beijingensis]|uniref:Uncharacterized protein n=1 Tax=Bhargavaea beijingensis TaxID=426756 RepID=A0A1G7A8M3_9BACL|nr:hypothetical protein [Bhargavaea beijingensis]SDE10405.1 hypothetical protein SAMN04488126_103213 [Bhargavaea beijingensis]